jgi:DNA replication protein DnaC
MEKPQKDLPDNNEIPEKGLAPIGQTLHRLARQTLSPPADNTAGGQNEAGQGQLTVEKKAEDCKCLDCGQTFRGEVQIYHLPGTSVFQGKVYPIQRPRPPREFRPKYCSKCQAKHDQAAEEERRRQMAEQRQLAVKSWRSTSGIPPDLREKTFESFEKGRQLDAYENALAWANGFDLEKPRGYPSLIFYSDTPGLGKTHLMVSIADYIFAHYQGQGLRIRSPIFFVKGPQLVRRIRWTFDIRKEDYAHEREEEVYREITGVPLLLLDDVGKESPSKFTKEAYWYIIDERVGTGLPVVITSRLPLEGDNSLVQLMGKDTVDRLYGMTRGEVIELTGQSYRRMKGIP